MPIPETFANREVDEKLGYDLSSYFLDQREPGHPSGAFRDLYCTLIALGFFICSDGFDSIYSQIIHPPDWPEVERVLRASGCDALAEALLEGKRLYYRDTDLANLRFGQEIPSEHLDADTPETRRFFSLEDTILHLHGQLPAKLAQYTIAHWDAL